MYVRMYVCMLCESLKNPYVLDFVCVCVCAYMYVCMHVCMYVCVLCSP
jgi:hypothetical protein